MMQATLLISKMAARSMLHRLSSAKIGKVSILHDCYFKICGGSHLVMNVQTLELVDCICHAFLCVKLWHESLDSPQVTDVNRSNIQQQ